MFNRFPAVVLGLSALIMGVSTVQFMADDYLENWMFEVGAILTGPDFADYPRPYGSLPSLVLHVLLHGGLFHLGMNMTAMIAFGPPVAMSFGRDARAILGFLIFFAGAAIAGALAEILWATASGQSQIVIGASSALSGFLPAVGWIQGGLRQAVRMSLPWLIINIVIAVLGNAVIGSMIGMQLAWAAHIGGLVGGFVLFPLLMKIYYPGVRLG